MWIETRRLRLRPFTEEDANAYYNTIFADTEVTHTLTGQYRVTHATDVRALIEGYIAHWRSYGYGPMAIFDRISDAFVGHCGLWVERTHSVAELLIALGRPFWGQRFAGEASSACLRFAAEELRFTRVVAFALPHDVHVQKVLLRLGMALDHQLELDGQTVTRYSVFTQIYKQYGPYALQQGGL